MPGRGAVEEEEGGHTPCRCHQSTVPPGVTWRVAARMAGVSWKAEVRAGGGGGGGGREIEMGGIWLNLFNA